MFVDSEIWRRLSEKIDEHYGDLVHQLITGQIATDDYRRAVGELRGLQFVRDAAQDVIKQINKRLEEA